MSPDTPDPDLILAENIRVHDREAPHYDAMHPEIFNRHEQAIVEHDLDLLLEGNPATAIDFGSGTGNLALKLLDRGLRVTAVDISREMLDALAARADAAGHVLETVHAAVDDYLTDAPVLADVVTMSSFLHQLPDPLGTLARVAERLPEGGTLYVTHEPTGAHPAPHLRPLALLDRVRWNLLHPRLARLGRSIDYSISDYHARDGIDSDELARVLEANGCEVVQSRLYTSLKSDLLSRLATRLGGRDQVTLVAQRTRGKGLQGPRVTPAGAP